MRKDAKAALENALQLLHVSAVPDSLPCRQDEFSEICGYLSSALEENTGSCIFVSGVPGTGKTATVRHVVKSLEERAEIRCFKYLEINGLLINDPSIAYCKLWETLEGKKGSKTRVSPHHAQQMLDQHFSNKSSKRKSTPIIVVLDELDQMINNKQTVIYNFLNWPNMPNSNLIVIAIANTMDLPERMLSNKITSRLGLSRVNFKTYTAQQLMEIVNSRLGETVEYFHRQVVEICAKKVCAVSGDARRMLDICRRTCEMALTQKVDLVSVQLVVAAMDEVLQSSAKNFLSNASLHQKIFLLSIMLVFRQSGLAETSMLDVIQRHLNICRSNKVAPLPTRSDLLSVGMGLGSQRILLVEERCIGMFVKLRLNVVEEDLVTALKLDALSQERDNFMHEIMAVVGF